MRVAKEESKRRRTADVVPDTCLALIMLYDIDSTVIVRLSLAGT